MNNTGEPPSGPRATGNTKGLLGSFQSVPWSYRSPERTELNLEVLPEKGRAEAVHWPKPTLLVGFILKVSQEVVGHEVLTPAPPKPLPG